LPTCTVTDDWAIPFAQARAKIGTVNQDLTVLAAVDPESIFGIAVRDTPCNRMDTAFQQTQPRFVLPVGFVDVNIPVYSQLSAPPQSHAGIVDESQLSKTAPADNDSVAFIEAVARNNVATLTVRSECRRQSLCRSEVRDRRALRRVGEYAQQCKHRRASSAPA
jgi:hypothetical protein